MVGKIERVPLRDVWKHEALDFTAWLYGNLDVLNEVLDVVLTAEGVEQKAGDFSVDLLARDPAGNSVVIENQLEKSDHDHLGKLITYLTAYDAKAAVWVVADARPEHVAAVTWLNQQMTASFYLVRIDAVRIGQSDPALLPTLIVGPSPESRAIGEAKGELAETNQVLKRFWTQLLERAKGRTSLHTCVSPGVSNWLDTSAGTPGLRLSYCVRKGDGYAYLWIDKGDGDTNRAIYNQLLGGKSEIETAYGGPLEWDATESRRSCVIRAMVSEGGYRDETKWAEVQDALIDAMVRLEKALRPHLDSLQP